MAQMGSMIGDGQDPRLFSDDTKAVYVDHTAINHDVYNNQPGSTYGNQGAGAFGHQKNNGDYANQGNGSYNEKNNGGYVEKSPVAYAVPDSSVNYVRPQQRKMHDSKIKFEEYIYYAQKTRDEEDRTANDGPSQGFLSVLFPTKSGTGAELAAEKRGSIIAADPNLSKQEYRSEISDAEWTNANRALRTAATSAIFYLITTDILGPFALPFAFASMGWGPGAALFTVFAGLAGYSGYLLWVVFLGMDSYEFPIKSFGDLGYRLGGQPLRYLFNWLQAIQLILNVGIIIISNGEALSQVSSFKLCYAICCLVFAIAGFLLGQVRTLQKFGWLANAAVFINVAVIAVSMYGCYQAGPNHSAYTSSAGIGINAASVTPVGGVYPPVAHFNGLPPSPTFAGSINGASNAVFAYGGSMIFPEFMSEMRRPRDFIKGMWAAQIFIYVVYMLYGMFFYYYQDEFVHTSSSLLIADSCLRQYVVNPSYLGINQHNISLASDIMAMVSALIAAALYGNIGIKVIYNNILVELFRAPPLTSRTGKVAWFALVPIYWACAFAIGAGIPDFGGLTALVGAVCILQFTYTFPPLLSFMYYARLDGMAAGDGFDPHTGQVTRKGSWIKGFFGKRWWMNCFNVVYMLGALALSGLGAYSAITSLIAAFSGNLTNAFVCKSPLDSS